MKVNELLSKVPEWHTVKRGRMERLGYADGYLIVMYKGSTALYIIGPDVPAGEIDKLLKVPYPDAILAANNKKHNWQTHKVDA